MVSQKRERDTEGPCPCQIKSASQGKQTFFVRFDKKKNVVCVMKKEIYEQTLLDILNCSQFKEVESGNDNIIVKLGNDMNSTLLYRSKQEMISKGMQYRLLTTGDLPARLCNFEKNLQFITQPTTVLSILGNSLKTETNSVTTLFEMTPRSKH